MHWNTHNDGPLNAHLDVVVQPDHDFCPLRHLISRARVEMLRSHLLQVLEDDILETTMSPEKYGKRVGTYDGLDHHPLLTVRHGGLGFEEDEDWKVS